MYKEVIGRTVDFLFNNQVVLNDQIIVLTFEERGIRWGSFKSRILRLDKKESHFLIGVKDNRVYINENGKIKGPFNDFFRIGFRDFNYAMTPKENKAISKMNLTDKLHFLLKRVYFHSKSSISHLMQGDLGPFLDLFKKLKKEKGLKNQGGITFKIKKIGKNYIELESYDKGGIFDTNTSNEGDAYPPQVMGEYYADAYSAYCFARKFLETKNKEYLEASMEALKFVKRTYDYYPAKVIWHSRDFKNPAYIETLYLIKPFIKKETYSTLYELIPKMREDLYEPTNVYALRYHWHSARNEDYSQIALNRLLRDQLRDGLIKDDNDNDYRDACDLTYHHYSLACLARGLSHKNNPNLQKVFLKGINFSKSIITKNGEISYNGRASNNIYHLASAIYVFEYASTLSQDNKDEFRTYSQLMFNYLKEWQQKDGSFPTAMNDCSKERAAWNHCATPYIALVGYFLYLAEDLHKPLKPTPLQNKKIILDRYAVFSNKNYYLTFFSGCNRSYGWSGETHRSGIPGIAILGKTKSLTPCLDETQNLIVSDIPIFTFNKKPVLLYGKGKLMPTKNGWIYEKKTNELIFQREYSFYDKKIDIETHIQFLKDGKFESYLIRIPLASTYKADRFHLDSANLRYIFNTSNLLESKEVFNPRGRAKVVYADYLNKDVTMGERKSYAYSILIR